MNKKDFRNELIAAREARGLTQAEVADQCKLSLRTIQRIESGQVIPRAYTIKQISKILEFEFFDSKNSKNAIQNQNPNHSSKLLRYLWYLKDLFNLKTNAMKKISILSSTVITCAFMLFMFLHVNAQTKSERNMNCLRIERNSDQSLKSVSAVFTNQLTIDSLIQVRNDLNKLGINLDYKKIEFDKNDHLLNLYAEVECNDGFSGAFNAHDLDVIKEKSSIGFTRNYDPDAENQFCTGWCKFE